eukprot:1159514-Pelagomonas_calceolata.AAC.1
MFSFMVGLVTSFMLLPHSNPSRPAMPFQVLKAGAPVNVCAHPPGSTCPNTTHLDIQISQVCVRVYTSMSVLTYQAAHAHMYCTPGYLGVRVRSLSPHLDTCPHSPGSTCPHRAPEHQGQGLAGRAAACVEGCFLPLINAIVPVQQQIDQAWALEAVRPLSLII